MNPAAAAGADLARFEAFQRKHRLGLLTLIFTDIVGSTQLKQQYGDTRAVELIQRHHAVIRQILSRFEQAEEIETAGDSFLLVFGRPSDAVKFSLLMQARLRQLAQDIGAAIFDRIGIHVGEVFIQEQEESIKLFGSQVDVCARVMSLGTANQILMTRFVFDNARQVLRGQELPGVEALRWLNHGLYQFKGIEEPTEVCEVRVGTEGPVTPPANSDKAQRYVLSEGEPVLGWRPALDQVVPGTKWIIERKLGEGGFGEVWLGRHETLKEKRVFKFCFRADRVRALKREVVLFRVMKEKVGQHPNIVGIQEVFFDEPPYYIVMDYAEAQDVRAWCESQGGVEKMPLEVRLEIVAQVADALQAAHQAGVIHRDVKPSNILIEGTRQSPKGPERAAGLWSAAAERSGDAALASAGKSCTRAAVESGGAKAVSPLADSLCHRTPYNVRVKLTDFGIGQVVSQESLAGMTRMGFTRTMVGPGSSSQTGTQIYMAPELLAGQPASAQSDIYSLGVVLFQLLVGNFSRPVTTDWGRKVRDPLLRQDLEKCFAGDPEERFASARELGANLRSLGRRRFQRRARKAAWITGVVLATVAVVAVGFYGIKRSQSWRSLDHSAPQELKTILILPLTNATPTRTDDYLSHSLTQESIRRMRYVHGLNPLLFTNIVKATQDRDFLGSLPGIKVLGGSFEKTAAQLKISLRFVTAAGDESSPEPILTDFTELPGVPSAVAREAAKAFGLRLSVRETQVLNRWPTRNGNAFDSYLRGQDHLSRNNSLDGDQAITAFKRATQVDTNFALAFVGLGNALNAKAANYKPEVFPEAFEAVQRALLLDHELAEAYVAQGWIFWSAFKKFDGENAVPSFQQALRLSPTVEGAHPALVFIYSHWGLLDEALKEANEELEYNRFNHQARWYKIHSLWMQRNSKLSLEELKLLPPDWQQDKGLTDWGKAVCHFDLHYKAPDPQVELQKADEILAALPAGPPPAPVVSSLQAMIYAVKGQTNQAEQQIAVASGGDKRITHNHHASYQIGAAYAIMKNNSEALKWLKRSAEQGNPCYPYFATDPSLNNLKGDPEFEAFIADLRRQMENRRTKFGSQF
jgi:serine/threonine protein kinase/class 3 adenylate cyclase/tetratricopeptide (TPR) repeat protein